MASHEKPSRDREPKAGCPGRVGSADGRPGRTPQPEGTPGRPDATLGRDPAGEATPGREQPPPLGDEGREPRPVPES
jgi:hypothetical protein